MCGVEYIIGFINKDGKNRRRKVIQLILSCFFLTSQSWDPDKVLSHADDTLHINLQFTQLSYLYPVCFEYRQGWLKTAKGGRPQHLYLPFLIFSWYDYYQTVWSTAWKLFRAAMLKWNIQECCQLLSWDWKKQVCHLERLTFGPRKDNVIDGRC